MYRSGRWSCVMNSSDHVILSLYREISQKYLILDEFDFKNLGLSAVADYILLSVKTANRSQVHKWSYIVLQCTMTLWLLSICIYFGRHLLQDDAHGSYDVIPAMPVHKYPQCECMHSVQCFSGCGYNLKVVTTQTCRQVQTIHVCHIEKGHPIFLRDLFERSFVRLHGVRFVTACTLCILV